MEDKRVVSKIRWSLTLWEKRWVLWVEAKFICRFKVISLVKSLQRTSDQGLDILLSR